jgi:signal peptidase I
MKRFVSLVVTVLCTVVCAAVIAVILLPAALGLQRYVITGGSMTGTIDKGSVVYSRLVPVSSLKAGDIITFVPPQDADPVTHRIVSVTTKQGQRVFRTKGDFNSVADPWTITFAQPMLSRCAYHIPYLGYGLALLSIRYLRMVLIGLPALIIAISLLWSLWRSAGDELKAQEAASAARGSTTSPIKSA